MLLRQDFRISSHTWLCVQNAAKKLSNQVRRKGNLNLYTPDQGLKILSETYVPAHTNISYDSSDMPNY
jgi:hypothetical protein